MQRVCVCVCVCERVFTNGDSAVDVSIVSQQLNQSCTVQNSDPQLTYIQSLTRHINMPWRWHALTVYC